MSIWGSKLSWMLLIIAIMGEYVVTYILALFYPEYSHMKQVMSVLGNPRSPVAFGYNLWLAILGLLMSFSAVNFFMVYSEISRGYAIVGAIILLIFGIGAGILSGIFHANETKEIETIASKIHGIGAGLGFMALTFIPLVVALLSLREANTVMGVVSIIIFIISIVLFVLFIMSERESFADSFIGYTGLWQRLLLASMYLPLLWIAIKHVIK